MYRHKRMMRDEEDDDISGVKNDKCDLEFTLWFEVLRWKNFHKALIEISLPIILYLHFICDLNSSILREELFAHLLRICTFVYVTLT